MLVITCVQFGCVMCLNSVMWFSISLCRYFREVVGISVGIFVLVASIVFQVVWEGGGVF